MGVVLINGERADPAVVSAFDAGLLHGVGLFETMQAVGSRVLFLGEHVERLVESARRLSLSFDLNAEALSADVRRAVEEAGLERGRVRLTVTGGDLNLLARARRGGSDGEEPPAGPTVIVAVQQGIVYPGEWFNEGVTVTIADWRANPLDPFAGHKTLNYWPRLRELQVAASKRAAEALVLQVTNHLAGGCVSNCVVVKGRELITPIARGEEEMVGGSGALPSPVLPGVTRNWVLTWGFERGMGVTRRMVSIDEVLDADEVLLTNSGWGVLPVVRVEGKPIGGGVVGEVGSMLREEWERISG
jgi:branched-subunit amino acid aminotransferase/4-amino-4-deoxychorismate lyase